MKSFFILASLFIATIAYADCSGQVFVDGDGDCYASEVKTDTTNFNTNLSSSDNTVQAALETLDELVAGGGGQWTDTGTILHPADLSGAETVVIGGTTLAAPAIISSIGEATFAALNSTKIGNVTASDATFTDAYISGQLGVGTPPNASYKITSSGSQWMADDNAHVYFSGANTYIGESSNTGKLELRGGGGSGTSTVYIDSSGRMGFGTASPTEKVYVSGNVYSTGSATFEGQILEVGESGTVNGELRVNASAGGGNYLKISADSNNRAGYDWIGSTGIHHFKDAVGIGTTSSTESLNISGNTYSTGSATFTQLNSTKIGTVTAEDASFTTMQSEGANLPLRAKLASNFGTQPQVREVGRLVAHHTSQNITNGTGPALTFYVEGSAAPAAESPLARIAGISQDNSVGQQGGLRFDGYASSAYTNLMWLDNDGEVGIGSTEPIERLHVAGNVYSTGQATFSNLNSTKIGTTVAADATFTSLTVQNARVSGAEATFTSMAAATFSNSATGEFGITKTCTSAIVVKGGIIVSCS